MRAWPGGVGNAKVGSSQPSIVFLFTEMANLSCMPLPVLQPESVFSTSQVASNYGPTIVPAVEAAAAHGTAQVLYSLPAASGNPDDATISEVGAMNFFVAIERADGGGLELVTPPLDGTILPGVTRDSILQLARSWNEFQVAERPITIGEIKQVGSASMLKT